MAEAAPKAGIHHGASGGMAKASNAAVTIALQSLSGTRIGRRLSLSTAASAASAVIVATTKLIANPEPKNQTCASAAGASA